jgi:catalase
MLLSMVVSILAARGAAGAEPGADVVVAALEKRSGVHAGQRRNHIKGTCALGEFTGLPNAQRYSRSPLFSGERVPVVARFSMAGGNPESADSARSPRGMALEFRFSDGSLQHMTMLNTPVFGANSPQGFLDEIMARAPDPRTGKPDPGKLRAFKAAHPENQRQADFLEKNNPPASWATAVYFGIHTFKFIDAEENETLVRWRFVPRDGEHSLSNEDLETLPRDFLEARLLDRVRRGPIHWDMVLTVGEPGDPENDATQPWPVQRQELIVGTLKITSAGPSPNAVCEKINFDPLVMTDGIAPTNDPVLLFRSPAYAISFGRRISGK